MHRRELAQAAHDAIAGALQARTSDLPGQGPASMLA
jgi:hypothetical protein